MAFMPSIHVIFIQTMEPAHHRSPQDGALIKHNYTQQIQSFIFQNISIIALNMKLAQM